MCIRDSGEDVQKDVYDKHLKEDALHHSWRGMKATEVARNIERQYTTDLELSLIHIWYCVNRAYMPKVSVTAHSRSITKTALLLSLIHISCS